MGAAASEATMSDLLSSTPIRDAASVIKRLAHLGAVDPDNRPGFLTSFVNELYTLAPKVRINPDWLVTQAAHETGDTVNGAWAPFVSAIWRARGNPGGIGVTDDNDLGYGFPDGRMAARAMTAHMYVYVYGNEHVDVSIVPYIPLDPRWNAVVQSGWAGVVDSIDDLAGRWASDPEYANKLRTRFAQIIDAADEITGEPTVATKPYVLISAGHRSTNDPGNPVEKNLTDELSVADVNAFRAAGFSADFWQRDLDKDSNPDQTIGDLTTMVLGYRRVIASRPEEFVVLWENHFNGTESAVHVIVPDVDSLASAFADGFVPADTAANNTLDTALATTIAQKINAKLGVALFNGTLGLKGVMSERESGVGLSGSRLGVFSGTAIYRDKAIRVIIEHGGTNDFSRYKNFAAVCAQAKVEAVMEVFGLAATNLPKPTLSVGAKVQAKGALDLREGWGASAKLVARLKQGTLATILDEKASGVAVPQIANGLVWWDVAGAFGTGWVREDQLIKAVEIPGPNPLVYPAGLDKERATVLFGKVEGYGFDENGDISRLWLQRGREIGRFPALIYVENDTTSGAQWFGFADGLVVWRPDRKSAFRELK